LDTVSEFPDKQMAKALCLEQ